MVGSHETCRSPREPSPLASRLASLSRIAGSSPRAAISRQSSHFKVADTVTTSPRSFERSVALSDVTRAQSVGCCNFRSIDDNLAKTAPAPRISPAESQPAEMQSADVVRPVQAGDQSDDFLTKVEFQTSLAKERDSLKRILHSQVEKLKKVMSTEVHKLNGRMDANAQPTDVSSEMRQLVNSKLDEMGAQVADQLQASMSAEVNKLNARIDKITNMQTDISSEMFQKLNARVDQLSAGIEKTANDFDSILNQTEAQVEKSARDILELTCQQTTQIEKNTEDILKMESALRLFVGQPAYADAANGVMTQVTQLNAIVESYQARLHKLESYEKTSAKSLQEVLQDYQRLQENDDALQEQNDCLQQQLEQMGAPLVSNSDLIVRMTTLEESMLQLSAKEIKYEGLNREVHQLLEQFSKHLESCASRLWKLEAGADETI